MKYLIVILIVFFASCSKPVEKPRYSGDHDTETIRGMWHVCYMTHKKVNRFGLITSIRKIPLPSSSSLPSSQSFSSSHLKSLGTHSPLEQENLSSSQAKYLKYRKQCV